MFVITLVSILRSSNHVSLQVDPNDQNGPDLETKIEELRLGIRRSEVSTQDTYTIHEKTVIEV
jgi:hypothetical protein